MIDRHQRAPGRGAYVHPSISCVERATRRGGVARHLRVSISPDVVAELARDLRAEIVAKATSKPRAGAASAFQLEEGQS